VIRRTGNGAHVLQQMCGVNGVYPKARRPITVPESRVIDTVGSDFLGQNSDRREQDLGRSVSS
jgi:hypothetical protein